MFSLVSIKFTTLEYVCREWRHFSYEPRIVKFASESECSKEKYVSSEVNLLQFSSATVPKVNYCMFPFHLKEAISVFRTRHSSFGWVGTLKSPAIIFT